MDNDKIRGVPISRKIVIPPPTQYPPTLAGNIEEAKKKLVSDLFSEDPNVEQKAKDTFPEIKAEVCDSVMSQMDLFDKS